MTENSMAFAPAGGLRAWAGFVAMSIGLFMAVLDIQIVASSLPDIQAGLYIPLERLSWVQTAYLSAEIVAIPLTGWLTRRLGLRGAFVASVLGFTVASALCAATTEFWWLIAARIAQGFCGGFLIPLAFSAVFLMFEDGSARVRATMLAGIMAMMAPTLGPTIGGFITDRYSWHWLFLINVGPGIAVAAIGFAAIATRAPLADETRPKTDLATAPLLALFLGGLQVVLSEAPSNGWLAPGMLALLAICLLSGAYAVRRCLSHPAPLVPLSAFRDRNFALGCALSFALGASLYGATFLLPLFLGIVRHHDPLEIGLIMAVTGGAQLIAAPIATVLETRGNARLMIGGGYVLLAIGLIGNGFMAPSDDFWQLAWQQAVRGFAFMFCLLPATSLALGMFPPGAVADASGLFNLMRNLGGAIGLAAIDTWIEHSAPRHAEAIAASLQQGNRVTAQFVGLPLDRFNGQPLGPIDADTRDMVAPLIEHAGLTLALNEAWLILGVTVLLALVVVPWLRPSFRKA